MRERQIEVHELETNLSGCLEEVQHGTTLLLTDGADCVARIVPEPKPPKREHEVLILPGKGRLKKIRPKARLRGEGSMTDLVRENRR